MFTNQAWPFPVAELLGFARTRESPSSSPGVRRSAALRVLGQVSLGQSDGVSAEDMPAVVETVVHAMGSFEQRYDVICDASSVLGRVAAFVLGCSLDSERRQKLLPCVEVACNTLLRTLTVRSSDAYSVLSVCNALIEIAEVCSEESPVRTAVRGRF